MKTHDDLRWDFKQETELNSVYRKNNNSQPFNESYVKWLEDRILLANGIDTGQDKCHIQRVTNCGLPEWLDVGTRAEAKHLWESNKVTDDGFRVKAVKLIIKRAEDCGYKIGISKASELLKSHCL